MTGGYLLDPTFLIDLLGSQRHLKSLCIVQELANGAFAVLNQAKGRKGGHHETKTGAR